MVCSSKQAQHRTVQLQLKTKPRKGRPQLKVMAGHQGLKEANIKLDSPRCVFYPGQTITGTLEVEVNSPLTFSGK